jgi:hypothetical protein
VKRNVLGIWTPITWRYFGPTWTDQADQPGGSSSSCRLTSPRRCVTRSLVECAGPRSAPRPRAPRGRWRTLLRILRAQHGEQWISHATSLGAARLREVPRQGDRAGRRDPADHPPGGRGRRRLPLPGGVDLGRTGPAYRRPSSWPVPTSRSPASGPRHPSHHESPRSPGARFAPRSRPKSGERGTSSSRSRQPSTAVKCLMRGSCSGQPRRRRPGRSKNVTDLQEGTMSCVACSKEHPPEKVTWSEENPSQQPRPYHCTDCWQVRRSDKTPSYWKTGTVGQAQSCSSPHGGHRPAPGGCCL